MQPDPRFAAQPRRFWVCVGFLNKRLGYRRKDVILRHDATAIREAFIRQGLRPPADLIPGLVAYFAWRADTLLREVKPALRSLEEARSDYEALLPQRNWQTKQPTNTPRGSEERVPLYLHATLNMMTEQALDSAAFDPDPNVAATFTDGSGHILEMMARRPDQAYPSIIDPVAMCESKEYYTAASGSKISDGIQIARGEGYETRGMGLENAPLRYLHMDGRDALWGHTFSEICKALDLLSEGLIDGLFFGRQILTDWPSVVSTWPTLAAAQAAARARGQHEIIALGRLSDHRPRRSSSRRGAKRRSRARISTLNTV